VSDNTEYFEVGDKRIEVPKLDIESPVGEDLEAGFQKIAEALSQGQAAVQELALLKPALALAISKLPLKQLKIDSFSEFGEWELQMKKDNNGAIYIRAVKRL
jgi:hypothetical protein